MNEAKVIQVSTLGDGQKDVMRPVRSYWTFDGALLAQYDPCATNQLVDELAEMRRLVKVQKEAMMSAINEKLGAERRIEQLNGRIGEFDDERRVWRKKLRQARKDKK